jgi:hypothetical protein
MNMVFRAPVEPSLNYRGRPGQVKEGADFDDPAPALLVWVRSYNPHGGEPGFAAPVQLWGTFVAVLFIQSLARIGAAISAGSGAWMGGSLFIGVKKLVPDWSPSENILCDSVRAGAYVHLVGCTNLSEWNWCGTCFFYRWRF